MSRWFLAMTLLVLGCGSSTTDDPTKTEPAKGAIALAAGGSFTCAVMAAGNVKCWGNNVFGALGDGTGTSSSTPVDVSGLDDVEQIAAGGGFACALKADGTVWCWGEGDDGQLGDGTSSGSLVPTQVLGLTDAKQIACGSDHACAIVGSLGEARCWGANNVAQLGSSTPLADGSAPLAVTHLFGATSLSAGSLSSCAIVDGSVQCWGAGPVVGGDGSDVFFAPTPLQNGAGFAELSPTASGHACGTRSDGRVACWGQNDVGQLGTAGEWSAEPLVVPGLENVASVSVGSTEAHVAFVFPSSACALLAGGSVHCWGSNEGGELGDGTTTTRATPAPVTGLNGAVAVSVGATDVIDHAAHTCALLDTGSVACWGSNDLGELGDGTTTPRSVPGEVALF